VRTPVAHDLSAPLRVLARRVGKPEPFEEEEEPVGAPARGRAAPVRDPLADDLAFSMLKSLLPPAELRGDQHRRAEHGGPGGDQLCRRQQRRGGPQPLRAVGETFAYSIYDKTGTRLLGPTASSSFWNGFAGSCGGNWSDVVVCSTIGWPTAGSSAASPRDGRQAVVPVLSPSPRPPIPRRLLSLNAYLFDTVEFQRLPQVRGVAGRLLHDRPARQDLSRKGLFVAAFERAKMLAGDGAAQMVLLSLDNGGNRAGMLPADWDGSWRRRPARPTS
jgi:hypothetical protein